MLSGLLEYQKQQFLQNGGIKEQMTKARIEYRNSQKNQTPQSPQNSQSPKTANYFQSSQTPNYSQSSLRSQSAQSSLKANNFKSAQSSQNINNSQTPPICPKCGKPMLKRIQKRGNTPGQEFWGCSDYPCCTGTRPLA